MRGLRGRSAVFLDRDGVLTEPVWNPATGEYESPHHLEAVGYCPGALAAARRLHAAGFALVIVSNQPSYAKGKVDFGTLEAIGARVEADLRAAGGPVLGSYYCYHHPQAQVPSLRVGCACRKPGAAFLFEAARTWSIDLARSWMIGDRDTDVACGQAAGCRTILLRHPHASPHQGARQPDHTAADLLEAAAIVLAADAGLGAVLPRTTTGER